MDGASSRCPVTPPARRQGQPTATRALLLRTAEQLYAERGIGEVSNRQVAEAAGQANTSAVAYHIGTKTDLVAAIVATHTEVMAAHMRAMADAVRGSTSVRDHVACVVRPYTDHLAELGTPSWWARVTAQITADPTLREIFDADPHLAPVIEKTLTAMRELAPAVAEDVAAIRDEMTRLMVVSSCAGQERSAARTGVPTNWALVGDTLVEGLTAILLGPSDGSSDHGRDREHVHRSRSGQ